MGPNLFATILGPAKDSATISLVLTIVVTGVVLLVWRVADVQIDAQEPPIVISRIPLIGHVVGMMRYQVGYFEMLRLVTAEISQSFTSRFQADQRSVSMS